MKTPQTSLSRLYYRFIPIGLILLAWTLVACTLWFDIHLKAEEVLLLYAFLPIYGFIYYIQGVKRGRYGQYHHRYYLGFGMTRLQVIQLELQQLLRDPWMWGVLASSAVAAMVPLRLGALASVALALGLLASFWLQVSSWILLRHWLAPTEDLNPVLNVYWWLFMLALLPTFVDFFDWSLDPAVYAHYSPYAGLFFSLFNGVSPLPALSLGILGGFLVLTGLLAHTLNKAWLA